MDSNGFEGVQVSDLAELPEQAAEHDFNSID
jgi:hypothetical protein